MSTANFAGPTCPECGSFDCSPDGLEKVFCRRCRKFVKFPVTEQARRTDRYLNIARRMSNQGKPKM